jgi:branched-chain amino acid transport system permease protein
VASAITKALQSRYGRNAQFGLAGIIAFYVFVHEIFPTPTAILFLGAVLGSLSALVAWGLVLIYRANRFISFAQGDLGGLAAILGVSLIVGPRWPFFPAFGAGIGAALVLGALVEFLFIRRFANAPRLILTVASIGISLILAGGQLALPRAFGYNTAPQDFPTPFDFSFNWSPVVFRGNHILAIVAVPVVGVLLGAFLRFSRFGIAVRGAADSTERAWLLGIPVKRLNTLVWIIAGGLSGTAVLLRAPIVGVSIGNVLGPALLLRALAAAVIGRMESLPVTFGAAVLLGMVEQAVFWDTGRTVITDGVLFFVVIGGLLLQRRGAGERADDTGDSNWSAVKEVRPIPPEMRHLPELRLGTPALFAALAVLLVVIPIFMQPSRVNLLGVGILFAMVGMSLILLTGWTGQISLGQMAFYGFGAAVAGTLFLHGWNFFICLVGAGLVGASVAVVIGLPALRIRGPFLAVATLAFGLATSSFFLNSSIFPWLVPSTRVTRPLLFGRLDLESEHTFYYVLLVLFALTLRSFRSIRGSRTGRVLLATRDNAKAAQSYGVNLMKARLTGFALSGFLAAFAGGVFMFHQHTFPLSTFRPEESIRIFSLAVVGGLGSVPGVVLGSAIFTAIDFFIRSAFVKFFASGVGLLIILLVLPGGIGGLLYDVRDAGLRWLAKRRGLVVPSLLADVRVDESAALETAAELEGGAMEAEREAAAALASAGGQTQ